jgi:uncharacterized protein YdhG (YjbR/CyaY superfamily)
MTSNNSYESVKAYFDAQPEKTKAALETLKACIFKVVPSATELLNYNIPAYALIQGGKRDAQIMIAGYARHVGLYPHPTTMEHFDAALKGYKKGKGSVQFPLDEPLPTALIERMIAYRAKLLSA